jgi:hypothetical protein
MQLGLGRAASMQRAKDIALRTLSMFVGLEAILSIWGHSTALTVFVAALAASITANALWYGVAALASYLAQLSP